MKYKPLFSSVFGKVIMAVSGAGFVLFLLFHGAMNFVSILSPESYDAICNFLGANWYAIVGTMGLAGLMGIHVLCGILLTAVGLVVVVCYAIFGLDPYLEGAAVFSAIAVSGIIFVELIAAISFIPYFARHRGEEGFETNPWVTVIAPAIASLGLLCVLALVLANFSLLTGFDNVVMNNLPVLLLLVGVVGFVHASRMDRDGRLVDPMDIDVNATEA